MVFNSTIRLLRTERFSIYNRKAKYKKHFQIKNHCQAAKSYIYQHHIICCDHTCTSIVCENFDILLAMETYVATINMHYGFNLNTQLQVKIKIHYLKLA